MTLIFAGLVFGGVLLARGLAQTQPVSETSTGPTTDVSAPIILPLTEWSTPLPDGRIARLANPFTDIPTRPRYDIQTYTVQKNDTLFGIAKKFNVDPETILWGNLALIENPNAIFPGQALNILPIDGALRVVQEGDTLEKIAKVFNGTVEGIVSYPGNDLDPNYPEIKLGQNIIIPGGWREPVAWQLPIATRTTSGSRSGGPGACQGSYNGAIGTGTFVWPAKNHWLSGTDYLAKGHPGLDIAAGMGAGLYASDTGVVVFAGWSDYGYGLLTIVDHGNGWQTVYAHQSQINVVCGQSVYQGNLIGLSGSTGNSTGAHLHFEMRNATFGRVNPWLYLPPP